MSKISFVDNNFQLVDSFLKRDYKDLAEKIRKEKDKLTFYKQQEDMLGGYQITSNEPLTALFGKPFFVVRFVFANIDSMHNKAQENDIIEIFRHLKQLIETQKGYYNIRIPSHIVDAVKAYNTVFQGGYFCGGTVEEVISGKKVEIRLRDGIKVFFADLEYINQHKEELMEMTFESFKSYQGQYHISPVTEEKAGKIYENWIKYSLEHCEGKEVVIAEYQGIPIGFVTIAEKENAVEGVLSAVKEEYRKFGAYRAMISYIVNYGAEKGKSFITSTQFDNFIVQGVWNSIGLKPFYSIYNFHIEKNEE